MDSLSDGKFPKHRKVYVVVILILQIVPSAVSYTYRRILADDAGGTHFRVWKTKRLGVEPFRGRALGQVRIALDQTSHVRPTIARVSDVAGSSNSEVLS